MTVDLKALGLDTLSADEMRELGDALHERADEKSPPPPMPSMLTETQREELRRRIAHADANPDDYVLWTDVLAESRRKYGYGD
jgi:hypothetical protein